MKTIVVATDFSNAGANAVSYAASLAKHLKARLLIFNTFHIKIPISYVPESVPDIDDLTKENKEILRKFAGEISRKYQIEAESVSSHGFTIDELKKVAREKDASLIVMGMKGEHSLRRKAFGSLTTDIIGEGCFHVLVIPEDAVFHSIKSILFACDGDRNLLTADISFLKEIAIAFESTVQIFHIVKEKEFSLPAEDKGKRKSLFNLEGVFTGVKHAYHFVERDNIAEGIEKGIEDHRSDLLVMAPHRRGFWDKFLNLSNTRRMALRTQIPLLSLQNNFEGDVLEKHQTS